MRAEAALVSWIRRVDEVVMETIIDRGMIFCHVLRTMQAIHDRLAITFGNQK